MAALASSHKTANVATAPSPLIDEAHLEDRLTALEAARAWSPRVVSRLEALIRSPDESGLFRVNPIKVAHERNIDEREAIDLFLHATAAGIFTMDWMVLCPLCSSIIESFGSLRTINANHYHCHFCPERSRNDARRLHRDRIHDHAENSSNHIPSAGDPAADRLSVARHIFGAKLAMRCS